MKLRQIAEKRIMRAIRSALGRPAKEPVAEPPAAWEMIDGNPDTLYAPGSVTFIYTKGGELLTRPHPTTHQQMYLGVPEVNQALFGAGNQVGHVGRDVASQYGLLGRISADKTKISFWNKMNESNRDALTKLATKLASDKMATPNTTVTAPGIPVQTIHQLITGVTPDGPVSRVWTAEEMAQLHTMPSDQKKKAMKELGLGKGFGSDKTTGMGPAMRKAGLIGPGQKWWAPNSEGTEPRDAV